MAGERFTGRELAARVVGVGWRVAQDTNEPIPTHVAAKEAGIYLICSVLNIEVILSQQISRSIETLI